MFNSLFACFLDPNAPNVVVTKLTLVCATAPGPLELDLTGELLALLPGQSWLGVEPRRRPHRSTAGVVAKPSYA